jgi:hypothetical protein
VCWKELVRRNSQKERILYNGFNDNFQSAARLGNNGASQWEHSRSIVTQPSLYVNGPEPVSTFRPYTQKVQAPFFPRGMQLPPKPILEAIQTEGPTRNTSVVNE